MSESGRDLDSTQTRALNDVGNDHYWDILDILKEAETHPTPFSQSMVETVSAWASSAHHHSIPAQQWLTPPAVTHFSFSWQLKTRETKRPRAALWGSGDHHALHIECLKRIKWRWGVVLQYPPSADTHIWILNEKHPTTHTHTSTSHTEETHEGLQTWPKYNFIFISTADTSIKRSIRCFSSVFELHFTHKGLW